MYALWICTGIVSTVKRFCTHLRHMQIKAEERTAFVLSVVKCGVTNCVNVTILKRPRFPHLHFWSAGYLPSSYSCSVDRVDIALEMEQRAAQASAAYSAHFAFPVRHPPYPDCRMHCSNKNELLVEAVTQVPLVCVSRFRHFKTFETACEQNGKKACRITLHLPSDGRIALS